MSYITPICTVPVPGLGCLSLMEYMGSDTTPAKKARTSFANTKEHTIEEDQRLTRYLVNHDHNTPVEMPTMIFNVDMPIFVARQWVRYRTASINEQSLRYIKAEDKFYVPMLERMVKQSTDNKQGSSEELIDHPELARIVYTHAHQMSYNAYNELLALGLAKELARGVLPLNTYTTWEWKNDLHNILNNFLRQRLDAHAQWEIRQYAIAMASIVRALYPTATEAACAKWKRHGLNIELPEPIDLSGCFINMPTAPPGYEYIAVPDKAGAVRLKKIS